MKKTRAQGLIALVLACGLTFASTNLFAQSRVPVGGPSSVRGHSPNVPGTIGDIEPQTARGTGAIQHLGFDGVDFLGSNCNCLPPDTNAAVSSNFIVEPVNVQIRMWDKNGNQLLDEPLATFFGAASGGDPYAVYDDLADRFYVSAFDSSDSGLFLAVSQTNNPTDGWFIYHLTNVNGFPDYNKMGYNKDAIFISYNNFGTEGGNAQIAAINKAQALTGTLTYFVSDPQPQFRAMPPAQMHGDTTGGVEWFVSTDGTDAGGTTMRVTKMTNYLSNSPTFTYTHLPVTQYTSAIVADQPGAPGSVTTFPNTTTYEVQFHRGYIVTAMASTPGAVGGYPKGMFYEIYVGAQSQLTPILLLQGVIDPGSGVAVQMPSVDLDNQNNLGFTWMESSNTEFLTMWVGTRFRVASGLNATPANTAQVPGFFFQSFRIGDYSTTVLDPSDGKTFWSANEYVGQDGANDIWLTHIQSFTAR